MDPSTTFVAAGELLSGEFDAETVILDLRTGVYYGLEEAGARIWRLLKSPTSLAALRDALVQEYDVEPRRCERDLRELLDQPGERPVWGGGWGRPPPGGACWTDPPASRAPRRAPPSAWPGPSRPRPAASRLRSVTASHRPWPPRPC